MRLASTLVPGLVLLAAVTASVQAQGAHSVKAEESRQSGAQQPPAASKSKQGKSTGRVTLKVKDSTIKYVIYEVARQAGLRPVYDDNDTLAAKRISVTVVNVPVAQAFTEALRGTGLEAKIASDGETVVIRTSTVKTVAGVTQSAGTVTGSITDSATETGIEGVTVTVVGTRLSVVTQKNGMFRIPQVPSGAQHINAKLFGYKAVSRAVVVPDSGLVRLHIKLAPTATTLSGVITTATGQQRRMEIGNDIVKLNVDSVMRVAPVSSLTDILETRVPGLQVMHSSGSPGARSYLRLRGTSSASLNSEPILIVDGVRVTDSKNSEGGVLLGEMRQSPFDQIDPNTIETIEVFKGPSASAMYGADAGDGVIVVTTKRGTAGRTRWTLALEGGYNKLPVKKWPVQYFRFGGIPYAAVGSVVCNAGIVCWKSDSIVPFQALNLPGLNPFGSGDNKEASMTVSGGSGAITYSLTGSGARERGISRLPRAAIALFERDNGYRAPGWLRRPDQLTTFGASSGFNIRIGNEGTIALLSNLFKSTKNGNNENFGVHFQDMYVDTLDARALVEPLFNEYYKETENQARFRHLIQLYAPIRAWLPVRATVGIEAATGDRTQILPRGFVAYGLNFTGSVDSIGAFTRVQYQSVVPTANLSTSVRTPGGGRLPKVLTHLGLNWNAVKREEVRVQTVGLERGVDRPRLIDNGTTRQGFLESSTFGWFVEPTVDMKSRFFVIPGLRFDGGSASGSRVGLLRFPKMNFSWIAVDRQGERPLWDVLTLFRPRLALGIAGVQPTPGDQLRTFRTGTRIVEDGSGKNISVARLTGFGNAELRPERSREVELGFDIELFESRITVNATGYQKLRYDAIFPIPLAPSLGGDNSSSGPSSIKSNVGDVRNTGAEITIGARVLERHTFSWQVNATGSTNSNRLLRLARGVPVRTVDGTDGRFVPGYPLFGVWIRQVEGYADANGDGQISAGEIRRKDSVTYFGAPYPKYELNLMSSVSVWGGRLSLSSALNMQHGLTKGTSGSVIESSLLSRRLDDPSISLGEQASIVGGERVEKVSLLRWQSLSASIEAPKIVSRILHASSLGLSIQGSNLGLFSNYRSVDPGIGASGQGNYSGAGTVPIPRYWQLRVVVRN